MAIWLPVAHVAEFPEVKKVFKRAGRGQGTGQSPLGGGGVGGPTTPASGVRGFLMLVKTSVQAAANGLGTLPSWIRLSPGSGPQGWQDCQVDVTKIPGVRALNQNGKPQGFAPL